MRASFGAKGRVTLKKLLRADVGIKDARVMGIGPAGEHLVNAAMLCNDFNHSASHSGGAIFGSKMLKGIVVYGTKRPPLHDKAALIEAGLRWRKTLQQYSLKDRYSTGHARHLEALPNNNMQSTLIGDHNRGFDQNRVVQRPCFQCARLCPWDVEIGEGEFKGKVGHFNAGAEWLDTFWNLGVKGNATLYLAERINDLGIECGHFSFGAGVLFEAYEKGLVTEKDCDGMKLEWGNVEAIDKLLTMTARRQGKWGNLIADGPLEVAEAIGGDAVHWVVHTKRGVPAMHDWRPHFSNMLREIVASGGMKPQGGGQANPPPDLKYREKWGPLDRDDPAGWPQSNVNAEQYRQFVGIMGGCWFAQMHGKPDGLKSIVDSFNAITGWNFTLDDAMLAGHRSAILQSLFATQRGWIADHDWQQVGQRFLDPVPDGKYQGFTIAKWLPEMVREYYQLSGRHEKTGRPFMDTLKLLGLEEFSEWAQLD